MVKWEYKRVTANGYSDGLEKQLNDLGQEGWELIAFRGECGVYLKRPIHTQQCGECSNESRPNDYLCQACRDKL